MSKRPPGVAELAVKVVALGRRGFSGDMIKRMISRDTGERLDSRTISRILDEAGLDSGRDANQHPTEMRQFTDPDVLRARWEKLLPGMKAKVRASLGRR